MEIQKQKSLNKSSIGIEIQNTGHQFGYHKFTNSQIKSLVKLSIYLIKKYGIIYMIVYILFLNLSKFQTN